MNLMKWNIFLSYFHFINLIKFNLLPIPLVLYFVQFELFMIISPEPKYLFQSSYNKLAIEHISLPYSLFCFVKVSDFSN